jgi:hypothetical protein
MNSISVLLMGVISGCVGGIVVALSATNIASNTCLNRWCAVENGFIDDIELQ